ncbi:MAG: hypothetical protein ACK6AO_03535 [Planctomycetota bacterium]|jgi:ribosome-associated translation inhibitor RaiA
MFDSTSSLRIELDTQGFELSAGEIADMEADLHTLRRQIEHFPSSLLHISMIRHQRDRTYHVKTSLTLCGTTLFTGDRDLASHAAFERCIHKLVGKVQAHKAKMAGKIDWNKATSGNHAELNPTDQFDALELDCAVAQDDYLAFRLAMDVFEDGLSKRVGRWINRYPQIEEKLGQSMTISDIVEEVFLIAFSEFLDRPHDVPPGKWLEGLIDPAVQALIQSPDEEYASISYSRAILERKS